jgi:Zn-dependent oligopeptidase
MDIESRRQTWEDLPSHLTDPRPPTPSVDSDFDPLAQFSNDELLTMIKKSKATSKKLCMREYQISKELEDLTRNIFENEAILKRLKKNKEDPQSNAEELKKREIRALLYNIQNYEKKIIKLEKEALDKNSSSKSPFLEELNKEFSEKGYAEKDRNRELG